jgi:hypothetical protein
MHGEGDTAMPGRTKTSEQREKRIQDTSLVILFCVLFLIMAISKDFWVNPPVQSTVKLGMTRSEVRTLVGSPNSSQEMNSVYGSTEYWYYGNVQVCFDGDKVTSINRY